MAEKQESVSANNSAGATPVDPKQNGRPSSAKQGPAAGTSSGLWFADDLGVEGKDGLQIDREERLRILREKQNEERQKKLDELKQQALAAQKFREQKEEERRRRMEELRMRDTDRRHQVEERKRQIWEAERDRRDAILRKNLEREARIETRRKNERSQIVFAFGSSTPRMLEPGEAAPYWATRRATSTTNVMSLSLSAAAPGPLTRRSSERELDGSKKRATSAGGIERKPQHDPLRMMSSSVYEVFHWGLSPTGNERSFLDDPDSPMGGTTWRKDAARRKTDLTPTLPAPKDGIRSPPSSGKKSSPGRAFSMSRLDILASPRRPKLPEPHAPISKGVEVYKSMSVLPGSDKASKSSLKGAKSMLHLSPTPPPRATRAERLRKKAREMAQKSPEGSGVRSGELTPSRPQSSMSQHSITSNLSSASASLRNRSAMTPRRPRPVSIAVTGVSSDKSLDRIKSPGVGGVDRPPLPKVNSAKKPLTSKVETPPKKTTEKPKSAKSSASTTPKATTPLQSPIVEVTETAVTNTTVIEEIVNVEKEIVTNKTAEEVKEVKEEKGIKEVKEIKEVTETKEVKEIKEVKEVPKKEPEGTPESVPEASPEPKPQEKTPEKAAENDLELAEADMSASMIAKVRITTEEAAKAALAERRRLAREQAEREAELERQRIEAERIAEEERLRKEEEEQKRMEEEQLRLLEEARLAEELRLQQAIEEAKKRDEEERKRKEEELKQKIEKEEAERKAKEEAEKLRIEMEQRLKKEEEDRQARRKRVEAIMLRTRGKGSVTSNTATSKDGEEDESPPEETKKSPEGETVSDQFINSERSHTDANTTNVQQNNRHNGHHLNGSYNSTITQNNVTNSLLVNLGEERVGQILDLENGGSGKLPSEQPQFIPQFQEKKEPQTVNDLLS